MFEEGFFTIPQWKGLVVMRPTPNPVQVVLREAMGIESFALDGDPTTVTEPWQDRPHLNKSPKRE